MKKFSVGAYWGMLGGAVVVATSSLAHAQNDRFALKGTNYLCRTSSHMSLWDSAASPLIRHRLREAEDCWKPMAGIHVDLLEPIGKFAKVRYVGNGIVAYAYASDLQKVKHQGAHGSAPNSEVARKVAAAPENRTVELEIHDSAKGELVRTIAASQLNYGDVLKKVGRLRSTHAISLRCNGFGSGRLSDDLYYSNGRRNSALAVDDGVSLLDVCVKMESTSKSNNR